MLGPLALSGSHIVENSAPHTPIGIIRGWTISTALTIVDTAGGRFALIDDRLIAGAIPTDFKVATTHRIVVRESLAGVANSPRDTVLTITVDNLFERPVLAALTLSATSLKIGTAASAPSTARPPAAGSPCTVRPSG